MEVKKTIRKIAAIGAGSIMLGATIMGAIAADLADYPAPFVTSDGKFDGLIVVGKDAKAEDVVGATDLASSLQFSMKKETNVEIASGSSVTISKGTKIARTGETFNFYKDMEDIDDKLDDSDLPDILADGRYKESKGDTSNDVTFQQTITWEDGTGTVTFEPDDTQDTEPTAPYLKLNQGDQFYTYELKFDDPVEFTNEDSLDFEGSKIEIQGKPYTIVGAKFDADTLDELKLYAGDTVLWLTQDQTVEKTVSGTKHQIKVVDVTEAEDSCGVMVDGDMAWIDKNGEETINGVDIAVLDAKAVHAQLQDVDICELNIGSTEVILKQDAEVSINGQDVEGSDVQFDQTTVDQCDSITVTYEPHDDVFLAEKEAWTDPVLQNWELSYGGMTRKDEVYTMTAAADKGKLEFLNNNGKLVTVPFIHDDTLKVVAFGEDYDYAALTTVGINAGQAMLLADGGLCTTTVDKSSECDGILMGVVSDGQEFAVVEVTNIDWLDRTVDLKDWTNGRTFKDQDADGVETIDLGFATIKLIVTDVGGAADTFEADDIIEAGVDVAGGLPLLATKATGAFTLDPQGAAHPHQDVHFYENYDYTGATVGEQFDVSFRDETVDHKDMELSEPAPSDVACDYYAEVDGSDNELCADTWGTIAFYDTDSKNKATLTYPEEEADANVFISPVGAEIVVAGSTVKTTTVSPISVGTAKLDSEVADATAQNVIAVGGPCANKVAASWLDNPADCAAGFAAGSGMIKLVEKGGKVGLVVAGYNAIDTRMATSVLAEFSKWKDSFKGKELKVSGPDLANIKVEAPQ